MSAVIARSSRSGRTVNGMRQFWRSVALVLSGTAAAQAIPLLGSLLLARLYAPAEFGLYAAWLGVVALAAVAVTGRFEQALAIEPDGESRRVAVCATLAVIAMACVPLMAVVWMLAAGPWPLAASFDGILLGAAIPAAALIASSQTWQSWAAAEGRFRDLALMRIAQAFGITGAQIVIGTLAPSASTLALAHLAGVLAGMLVAVWRMPLTLSSLPRRGELLGGMRSFWSRYRRFPLLSLPADSINTAAGQLPLVILASRFGADIAGFFALTLRALGAPIGLMGAAVLDVFKRRAATSYRASGQCRDDYLQTFKVLALGSLVVVLVTIPFSEPLFVLAFGERWRMSGTIALWMLPMFAFRFVASPLSYMFYVAGKQHVDLLWQACLLAMTLMAMFFPPDAASSLKWYSAGYSALYGIYLVMSYRFSLGVRA